MIENPTIEVITKEISWLGGEIAYYKSFKKNPTIFFWDGEKAIQIKRDTICPPDFVTDVTFEYQNGDTIDIAYERYKDQMQILDKKIEEAIHSLITETNHHSVLVPDSKSKIRVVHFIKLYPTIEPAINGWYSRRIDVLVSELLPQGY